jgi:tetratricopeptide (TPR) repeat protein
VLAENGNLGEALASCDESVANYAGYADGHANRGVLLGKLNRLNEMVRACDKALQITPSHHIALSSRSWALLDLRRLDEALANFKKLGADPLSHFGMGKIHLLNGDFERGLPEKETENAPLKVRDALLSISLEPRAARTISGASDARASPEKGNCLTSFPLEAQFHQPADSLRVPRQTVSPPP